MPHAASESTLTRAASGYRATLVSQGVRLACKIIGVVVLARLVSPAEHGIFAMAASVMFFFVLFRDVGLSAAAIQAPTLSAGQMTALFRLQVGIGLGLGLIMLLLAPVAAAFYREPRLTGVLSVMSASFLLIGASAWPRTRLARELRFRELNRLETAGAVVGTIAMIAAGGTGAYAFVTFLLVSEAVMLVLAWRHARGQWNAPPDWAGVRRLLRTGTHLLAYNGALYGLQQVDAILMGRWFGAAALGPYNRAGQLLVQPATHLATPFTQVLLSTLSRLGTESVDFAAHFRSTTNTIAYLTLPLAVLCFALPDEMVSVVLGANWPDAAPLLRWLALSAGVSFVSSTLYALCVATGKSGRLTAMTLVTLAITLGALWLGRGDGPVGLARALAATNVLLLAPRLWWAALDTPVGPADFLRAFAGPLWVAIAFGGGLLVGRSVLEAHSAPLRLLGALGVGVVAVAALMAASRRVRREIGALRQHLPRREMS
jgi:O-antigen/teichoic acid export membrane protein